MTAHSLTSTDPVAHAAPAPPSRRATGISGLLTVATFAAAVLVAPKQDLTTSTQLHAYLEDNGSRQALAWVLTLASGLAWLLFVVGLRRLLPDSHGRDLFTVAALAGQGATWAGTSLSTAAAPAAARAVSLPVYEAFGEAGHLAVAAGTAATGLAFVGLARAVAQSRLWSKTGARITAVAGVLLVIAAVVGPVSVPVYVLWLLGASILLVRARAWSGTSVGGARS